MDLTIKCRYLDSVQIQGYSSPLLEFEACKIDNIDDIAAFIVKECDPAYLVTTGNRDGLLESIGKDYVKEYFGLVEADA
jgi:hypothetical protein